MIEIEDGGGDGGILPFFRVMGYDRSREVGFREPSKWKKQLGFPVKLSWKRGQHIAG